MRHGDEPCKNEKKEEEKKLATLKGNEKGVKNSLFPHRRREPRMVILISECNV